MGAKSDRGGRGQTGPDVAGHYRTALTAADTLPQRPLGCEHRPWPWTPTLAMDTDLGHGHRPGRGHRPWPWAPTLAMGTAPTMDNASAMANAAAGERAGGGATVSELV